MQADTQVFPYQCSKHSHAKDGSQRGVVYIQSSVRDSERERERKRKGKRFNQHSHHVHQWVSYLDPCPCQLRQCLAAYVIMTHGASQTSDSLDDQANPAYQDIEGRFEDARKYEQATLGCARISANQLNARSLCFASDCCSQSPVHFSLSLAPCSRHLNHALPRLFLYCFLVLQPFLFEVEPRHLNEALIANCKPVSL